MNRNQSESGLPTLLSLVACGLAIVSVALLIYIAVNGVKVTVVNGTDSKDKGIPIVFKDGTMPVGTYKTQRPVEQQSTDEAKIALRIDNLDGDRLQFKPSTYTLPDLVDQWSVATERAEVVIDSDSPSNSASSSTSATPQLEGVRLTVTISSGGKPREDALGIRSSYSYGDAKYSVTVVDKKIKYELDKKTGVEEIGTFSGGNNGKPLEVKFSVKIVPEAIAAVLRSITYSNSKALKASNGERTVQFAIKAKDCADCKAESVIKVGSDAPVISGLDSAVSYTSGTVLLKQEGAVTVEDKDSTDFANGKLTVSIAEGRQATEDALSIFAVGATGDIGVRGNSIFHKSDEIGMSQVGLNNELIVNFTKSANCEAVAALIKHVAYQNRAQSPTATPRKVKFQLEDGTGGTSADYFVTLNFTNSPNTNPSNNNPSGTFAIRGFKNPVEHKVGNDPSRLGGTTDGVDSPPQSFSGGDLTVAITDGDTSEDVLSVISDGSVRVGSDGKITYSSKVVGTVAGGDGADLKITFTDAADKEAVEWVMYNVGYKNKDTTNPKLVDRKVRLTLKAAGQTAEAKDLTIKLSAAEPVAAPSKQEPKTGANASADQSKILDRLKKLKKN